MRAALRVGLKVRVSVENAPTETACGRIRLSAAVSVSSEPCRVHIATRLVVFLGPQFLSIAPHHLCKPKKRSPARFPSRKSGHLDGAPPDTPFVISPERVRSCPAVYACVCAQQISIPRASSRPTSAYDLPTTIRNSIGRSVALACVARTECRKSDRRSHSAGAVDADRHIRDIPRGSGVDSGDLAEKADHSRRMESSR